MPKWRKCGTKPDAVFCLIYKLDKQNSSPLVKVPRVILTKLKKLRYESLPDCQNDVFIFGNGISFPKRTKVKNDVLSDDE